MEKNSYLPTQNSKVKVFTITGVCACSAVYYDDHHAPASGLGHQLTTLLSVV